MSMKLVKLGDILSDAQGEAAMAIVRECMQSGPFRGHELHKRLVAEIFEPHMADINARTGQENDAGYLAYAFEHAVMGYINAAISD